MDAKNVIKDDSVIKYFFLLKLLLFIKKGKFIRFAKGI